MLTGPSLKGDPLRRSAAWYGLRPRVRALVASWCAVVVTGVSFFAYRDMAFLGT